MLLTNSKLLANKQMLRTRPVTNDKWQKSRSESWPISHLLLSQPWVSESKFCKKKMEDLCSSCHSINLTMDTKLWVLFAFTYFSQVSWNNIPNNKKTKNRTQFGLVHWTPTQCTKFHHSCSINWYLNVSIPHYGLNSTAEDWFFHCFLFYV